MKTTISILLFSALTAHADTNLVPFLSIQNGKAVLSIQASNGVGNFRLIGSTVTATNPVETVAVTNEWVTSQTLGTLRSDFTGYAGCYLTNTSASGVNVTHLGRWVVDGNDDMHTLYVLTLPAMTTLCQVTFTNIHGTPGAFMWGEVSATLAAGTTYALVSTEASGGDQFYDSDTAITCYTTGGITNGLPCYSAYVTDTPTTIGTDGHSFGPVSMKFE